MKHEELRKLKAGDKVIVKIDHVDYEADDGRTVSAHSFIPDKYILGIYHEPTKIKMTAEEKKEFDLILKVYNDIPFNFFGVLSRINNKPQKYPNLYAKLFLNRLTLTDRKNQSNFIRALENSDLIEVEKPKKYYVHLFPGEHGYLNKFESNVDYTISGKDDKSCWSTAFTKEEIDKIPQDALKITDKALEEVEEE